MEGLARIPPHQPDGEVLPKAFDDAHFAFYGTEVQGTPQQRPRDKRALSSLNASLGDAIGKPYAEQIFPRLVQGRHRRHGRRTSRRRFEKRIDGIDWMAPATKAEAKKKVATMVVGIGYPDKWRD